LNKRLMAVAVLALILLAVAAIFGSRDPSPEPALRAATPIAPSTATGPMPGANLPPPARPGDSAPAPWAANSAKPPALPVTVNPPTGVPTPLDMATPAQRQHALKELEQIRNELAASMRDGKQPDPKKVVEALTRLKRTYGSQVAGVNLDAVINNVEKAQEIQALALKMQSETSKPGGPDQKALMGYVEQLKKLQAQLRTDISVPQNQASAGVAK